MKYDNLLRKVLQARKVLTFEAGAPSVKSRPKNSNSYLIFTAVEKFPLIEEILFNKTIKNRAINLEVSDIWAVFSSNGKLYVFFEYEDFKALFPNPKQNYF